MHCTNHCTFSIDLVYYIKHMFNLIWELIVSIITNLHHSHGYSLNFEVLHSTYWTLSHLHSINYPKKFVNLFADVANENLAWQVVVVKKLQLNQIVVSLLIQFTLGHNSLINFKMLSKSHSFLRCYALSIIRHISFP